MTTVPSCETRRAGSRTPWYFPVSLPLTRESKVFELLLKQKRKLQDELDSLKARNRKLELEVSDLALKNRRFLRALRGRRSSFLS